MANKLFAYCYPSSRTSYCSLRSEQLTQPTYVILLCCLN